MMHKLANLYAYAWNKKDYNWWLREQLRVHVYNFLCLCEYKLMFATLF